MIGDERTFVLNVDDNEAGLYAKTRILRRAGFEVLEASNGTDALQIVKTQTPHLVLCDVQLPDISGLEVCRRIKSDPKTKRLPVLHISATYVTGADQIVSVESGADIYLVEPIEPEELITVVNTLLRLRKTELVLQESEERLRLATQGAGIATWDIDLRTGAAVWSETLDAMLGYSLTGDRATWALWRERIHPDDVAAVDAALAEAEHSRSLFQKEHRIRRAGSLEERWVAPLGKVYVDDAGNLTRMLGVAFDVTARKQVEVERETLLRIEHKARTQAEEVSRLKDQFLATLSHELRTPMTAVLGWLQMLQRGDLPAAQQRQALDTIEANARLQNQLINDILDVSRIITGKLNLELLPMSPAAAVRSAVASMEPQARAKGIDIDARYPDADLVVRGDATRLQQVFTNLIGNAIKFSPAGTVITIDSQLARGSLEVGVGDQGEGIAPEMLDHLFERFRQADGSITRAHGGLGLGLAIVRYLVELHGGAVTAQSDGKGRGSRFTVRLPTSSDSVLATGSAHERHSASAGFYDRAELAGTRLLIVDDDESTVLMLGEAFSGAGAQVATTRSVDDALVHLRAHPDVEVLISDIGLPGRDGYDLMTTLRREDPRRAASLVAIAISGYARPEDRRRAVESGFDLHLAKPFDLDELSLAIALMRRAKGAAPQLAPAALEGHDDASSSHDHSDGRDGGGAAPPGGPRVGRNVLVVDDHPDIRDTLAALLGDMGHEVRTAADGDEALGIASVWHPDFVLIDLNMPGANGWVVAQRLRALEKGAAMKLVMLTAEDVSASTAALARTRGFDYCFDKIAALPALESLLRDENEPG